MSSRNCNEDDATNEGILESSVSCIVSFVSMSLILKFPFSDGTTSLTGRITEVSSYK